MQYVCAILPSVACLAAQYFETLSRKRWDFRKKVNEYETNILILSTNFVWNISHSKKNYARCDQRCILVLTQSTRCFFLQILRKLEFSQLIFEKCYNIIFYKNPSSASGFVPCWGTKGWADGQTDTTKLIVTFRNFANAPKK